VIDQLLQTPDCTVYPLNPKAARAYRNRKAPSGAKSDHLDAWSFADALRLDGSTWKPLCKQDPLLEQLHLLCRDELALIEGFRLTNHMVGGVGLALGLMVDYFRAKHAAGVSSLTRFAGKFSKPGSTALRYSRTGICSLRQVSTIEMMAATRGPACSLPTWIQFLRPMATGRIEFSVALLLSSSSG
jgi:Transposase